MIMMMNNPTTMSPSKCWYVGNVVQNAAQQIAVGKGGGDNGGGGMRSRCGHNTCA